MAVSYTHLDVYKRQYEGIAFQYMAPSVFEDSQFEYVQNHLRIISAFYLSLIHISVSNLSEYGCDVFR